MAVPLYPIAAAASGAGETQTGAPDEPAIPAGVDPFFYAQFKFDCYQYDACIDLCTKLLKYNSLDRAVWMLKTRALTEKMWIDDTEMEEEGVAELLMDDNALAQLPRAGTSLHRPITGSASSANNPAMRPVTATGRPVSGFLRPGTSSRPITGMQTGASSAFKSSRAGSSRPMTSLGRAVRLGTASMMSQEGGPFIDVERLDMKRYAGRAAVAKALCEYILYHDHNPRKAVELAAAATVKVGFADWWWKSRLGKAYYQLGLLREAERQFKSSLQTQPTVDGYLELCKCYMKLDQPATALQWYSKGLQRFPDEAYLLQGMARVHEMLGEVQASAALYRRVLSRDAGHIEAIASLASNFFYSDRPEIALRYYRRLLQMGVHSAELWTNLGLCCFYASQFDMALTCLERALAMAEDDAAADVWYNVGHIGIGIGDMGVAYYAFKVALAADPQHAEAMVNLGVLEMRRGNVEAARASFRSAARLAPHLYEAQFNGALLAYKVGQFQEAFEMVGRALEAYPEHADSLELRKQLQSHFTMT